jgi:tetratricopeptide (TPR) repeat protein
VAERSRLDDLERRVQHDPASIAFAQLAEEYRRAGRIEDAVRVCRAGLQQHPAYLSARVTLGRALIDLRHFREAREELERVVREAPDNLAAIRALADLHQRAGEEDAAPAPAIGMSAAADLDLAVPRTDADVTRALHAIDALDLRDRATLGGAADQFEPSEFDIPDAFLATDFADGRSSFDPGTALDAVDQPGAHVAAVGDPLPERFTMWSPAVPAEPPSRHELDGTVHLLEAPPFPEPVEDPALCALESWLDAVVTERASRI